MFYQVMLQIPTDRASWPRTEVVQKAREWCLRIRADGKVLVEIVGRDRAELVASVDLILLGKLDVKIAKALVPANCLSDAAVVLPEVYR